MTIKFGQLFTKYGLVTLLPTFVAWSIYADWTYTKKCKARDQEAQQNPENVSVYS